MPRKRRSYFLPTTGDVIAASKVKRMNIDDQMRLMHDWFDDQYLLPTDLPYDSSEGGYQWIWGGPYDPKDVLQSEFEGVASDAAISKLASDLYDLSFEWSGKPDDSDLYNEYLMYRWVPEDIDDPYDALVTTLVQIEGTAKRPRTKADQEIIYRLLFANIITALEIYLGDAFSSLIFSWRDLFEKFVRNSGYFQNQNIQLSEIFERLQTIEADVRNLVSRNVWHKLVDAEKLYSQAFGIKFPPTSETLRNGIRDRHDIVHRNGKSTSGVAGSWDVEQIKILKNDVLEFATEIEGLLRDLPGPKSSTDEQIQI